MNVFDFDKTIYRGDSTIDFWLFCLCKNKKLLQFLPRQFFAFFLYALHLITKQDFKSRFFIFLSAIPQIDEYVKEFWDFNEKKIANWYLLIKQNDDCVISASPEFLLKQITERLGIVHLIATKVDTKTGILQSKNCYGKNKPVLFAEKFGNVTIDCFYTDSKSDLPMAKIAKKAFLVKLRIFTQKYKIKDF